MNKEDSMRPVEAGTELRLFSSVQPRLHPGISYKLEALEIEPVVQADGVVLFLLVRYFARHPVEVEGDHLFFSLDELLECTESYYGVPADAWRLEPTGETGSAPSLVRQVAAHVAQKHDVRERLRFPARGECE